MESALRRLAPAGLRLIETFRRDPETGFVRLEAHLARLGRGAAALGIAFDRRAVERALAGVRGEGPLRVRLTLGLDGGAEATAAPLVPGPAVWSVMVGEERLDPADPWLGVKTTERGRYDAARAALPAGVDETIFLNTRGEVCEGTIFNVFLEAGGVLLTPPLGCGLLPGVLREELLRRGKTREAVLRLEDLRRGRLLLGNSLRGLCAARLA